MYEFCGLAPGQYTLTESLKTGYQTVSVPGIAGVVNLVCNTNLTNQNFTNTRLRCISGYKLDCRGVGLEGWTINLTNSTGAQVGSTTTGDNGFYQFCGLIPGNYNVSETMKPGYEAITTPGPIQLLCDQNSTNQNFTNRDIVSLNITKTANTTGPVLPGQVIEYTIKVCNTGNLTLNNVNVTDNRTGSYTIASIPKGACNETKALYTVPEQRHL